MPKSTRASKSDVAYEAIKDRISGGSYTPGSRLVLDHIAADLNMSPVPVREAIRRLEAEGYVDFKRNVGAQVASINADRYEPVMEVLALLEGAATAAAAPHISDDQLDEAREINEQMRESLASFDPVGFTLLNQEFHRVLCSPCPNSHLLTLMGREAERLDMIRRSTFGIVPGRAAASVSEHDELVELVTNKAPSEDIDRAAREHKLATLRAFQARSLTRAS